jgi:hypothetical protein
MEVSNRLWKWFKTQWTQGAKLGSHDSKRDETYKGIRLAATDRDIKWVL